MCFWMGMREAQVEGIKNRQRDEQVELEEKRYQQGRTDRAEEMDLATMTSLRGALLPSILDNYKLKKSDRAKTAQDILLATNAGFSRNAATYVVGSGKWTGLQEILKKHGVIGEAFIADTQQKLNTLFPDMTDVYDEMGCKSYEDFRSRILRETGVSFCTREHFGTPLKNEDRKYIRFAYSGIPTDSSRILKTSSLTILSSTKGKTA